MAVSRCRPRRSCGGSGGRALARAGGWREAVAPELLRVLLEERNQDRGLRTKLLVAAALLAILGPRRPHLGAPA